MEKDEDLNEQPEPDLPDANSELQQEPIEPDFWLRNAEDFNIETGHLSVRATGNSVAKPILPSDEMPLERINFTPIKQPGTRSYVEQLLDPNRTWEKPKTQRIPEAAERVAAWFSKDIAGFVSQNNEFFPGFVQDAVSGTDAFCSNYISMRVANVTDADKYFHCMANCEAANSGTAGNAVAHTTKASYD